MSKKKLFIGICVFLYWSSLAGAIYSKSSHGEILSVTPFTWFQALLEEHEPSHSRSLFVSALFSGALTVALLAMFLSPKRQSPYGDARWATSNDIRKAGLFGKNGLILGKHDGDPLCVEGWEHVMCFAPSGSGKGVGIVVPNLLHWPDSAIVHDVKGENFRLTSGFRAQHGQNVFFFNPGDPQGKTHRYNPFQFVSHNLGIRIDDLQKIAHLLMPNQDFWENEARSLLVGLSLYLLNKPGAIVTFGNIVALIRSQNFSDFVTDLLISHRDSLDPAAAMLLNAFIQKAEKERSAVISTLNSSLELWANPLIDAATSSSDFDLRKLKSERTTIYVGVSPNNLHRLQPLLQIFYQQATDILTEKEPDLAVEPYGVLFMMDEFASLGKMEQFEKASAYFRGYRVRFFMIIQDLPQLERYYQRAGLHSFLGMSKVKITFAADNYETASLISKYLGTYGEEVSPESHSDKVWQALTSGKRMNPSSKISRPLLLPQEILQLPREEEIIMVESTPPVRATKIKYYEEDVFKKRLAPAVVVNSIEPLVRDINSLVPPKPREFTSEEIDELTKKYHLEQETPDPEARPA